MTCLAALFAPRSREPLYSFAASLSQPILSPGDVDFAITMNVDLRSSGQLDWQKQIVNRLARANEAGGIHGRNFLVTANSASPLLTIDLTRSSTIAKRITPTVLLQADSKSPLMKAIESSVFDEVRSIVAAYPGEKVLIIDPLAKGPGLALLKGAIAQGAELLSAEDCTNIEINHIIIISMGSDAELGLLPPTTYVFTPVPTGEQFTKIPETIAEIVIDMARRMGANPDRATQIQAFDQAWRSEGRGDTTLFSGASLVEINPLDMSALGAPVWRDAP